MLSSTLSHQGLKAVSASENWRPAKIALVIELMMSIDSVYGLLFCFDVWNIIFCFYQQITHDARLIFLIPGSSTLQHLTHLTVAAAPDSVYSVDRHHID